MRRSFELLFAACLLCSPLFAGTPAALKTKTYVLENGMKVWINEDHSTSTAYGAVVVNAGAMDCPGTGIAHYFEHMMFKGTDKIGTIDYAAEKPYLDSIAVMYDSLAVTEDPEKRQSIQMEINRLNIKACDYAIPNEFDALTTAVGSSNLNAYTSYDQTVYHSNFIPAYFRQWAEINSERVAAPVFRLFQSELETVYEEKNMYDDNAMQHLLEEAMTEFFKGTAYEYPVIGTTENLKNPQLNRMAEFFDKYYVANNMTLIITGDVYADEILPVIKETFGTLRSGAPVTHAVVREQEYGSMVTKEIVADIPLVKIGGFMYRGTSSGEPDEVVMTLAGEMLNNMEGTGMLDKLVVENKLMGAQFLSMSLNRSGLVAILVIPKLIGQKLDKAEEMVMDVVKDLVAGRFEDSLLESCKLDYRRRMMSSLETIDDRIYQMASVASSGREWEDYLADLDRIDAVTREDIMSTMEKYIVPECLHIVKKTGKPERDNLQKPPYERVIPAGKDSVSVYARALKSETGKIVPVVKPVDFTADADCRKLTDKVTLYSVKNPLNDIFSLDFAFRKGRVDCPALEHLETYLTYLGTSEQSHDEYHGALQQLGGGITFESNDEAFTVNVSGFDSNFANTVGLASKIFTDAKGDKNKLKALKSDETSEKAMTRADVSEVGAALYYKVAYGEDSPKLVDKGAFKDDFLMQTYAAALGTECNIYYSGGASPEEVEAVVREALDLASVTSPSTFPAERRRMDYQESAVYFIDMPTAAQASIYAYLPSDKLTTREDRAIANFYGDYLGGGMTSLLFQEIREFRSMAYSTYAVNANANWDNRDEMPAMLVAFVGTQCDKAVEAISVVDSLIRKTPMLPGKFQEKKKEALNEFVNSYPTFRNMGKFIAGQKEQGYESDSRALRAEIVENLDLESFEAFWRAHYADKPIIWCVAGNASRIDMDALSKYGPVTKLKVNDVIK